MNETDRIISCVFAFLIGYYMVRVLLRSIEVYGEHCYMDGVNDTKSIFGEIKAHFEQANRNDGAAKTS